MQGRLHTRPIVAKVNAPTRERKPLFKHEPARRSHTVQRYCGVEACSDIRDQLQHARCTTHATSPYNLLLPQIASTRRCAMSQMVRTSKLECRELLVPVCETQGSGVSGPARPPGRGTSSQAHEDGRARPHHSHHRHIPLVLHSAEALVATQHWEVSFQHMIAASDISDHATCRCLIQVQQASPPSSAVEEIISWLAEAAVPRFAPTFACFAPATAAVGCLCGSWSWIRGQAFGDSTRHGGRCRRPALMGMRQRARRSWA